MRAVNLLPAGERGRRPVQVPPNASYFVLGILAALLLAVVALVMTQNKVTTTKAEIAKAEQETQAAQAQVAQLGPFGQFAQIKQSRLQSVTELSSARFDWERMMRELALVLPDDVWVLEANASAVGGQAAGAAAPGAGTAVPAGGGPTLQLVGCAPSQPDVAGVMVRLGNLHRAEDVTLAESGRQEEPGEAAATTEGCGSSLRFDVSIAFSATPAPEGQEGESGETVPSQLGGGA
jgi:Tfp pilus assembly protein PilN